MILALSFIITVGGEAVAATTESFIKIGPGTVVFGAYKEQTQGPVVATDGGVLSDGRVVQQGEILAVLDNVLYVYPAGTDINNIVAGYAAGVQIIEFAEGDKEVFTLLNRALMPAEHVSIGADDSQRCLDAGGCTTVPPRMRP